MRQKLKNLWARYGITRSFLKGWRTRLFAFVVVVLGVLETLDPYMLAGLFGYQYHGLVLLAIGLISHLLREITSTPPGSEGNTESWWVSTAQTENTDEGSTASR